MSLQPQTASKRGPWLLTIAVIWIVILFLKSIEPPQVLTAWRPATSVAAPPITTTAAVTVTAPITTGIVTATTGTTATADAVSTPTTSAATNAAVVGVTLGGDAANGKVLFASTCAACHGPNGEGVKGLGKDMTTSEFIATRSDAELLDFIKEGRAPGDPLNTTGIMMPPKGGNPTLDDAKLTDIVAFIRSIHKPTEAPAAADAITTTAPLTATPLLTATAIVTTTLPTTTAPISPSSAAPPPSVALTGAAANGKVLFATTCAACHGPLGEGVKGLGKDMTTSEFIASLSDPDLLAFIKVGRAPGDPLNTTGVMMPPKGGNPTLDDAKLLEIIAFIRAIQKR